MNLMDFTVLEILEETYGKVYALYGMTKEQAEAYPDSDSKYLLFLDGVKQCYKYDCFGQITTATKVFINGVDKPYYVGYRGLC